MALSEMRLDELKKAFLSRFEGRRGDWKEKALRDATTSSSRRARLYRIGLTQRERDEIRTTWWEWLRRGAETYGASRPGRAAQAQFEKDICTLRSFMSRNNYAEFWRQETVGRYPPGFRVSHAQKSLSLVLKHYWCNGAIEEPPCCPIDRWVLKKARDPDPTWTHIDTLPEYHNKLDLIRQAAKDTPFGPISLSEWELWAYETRSGG
jgi:hypothetical protein